MCGITMYVTITRSLPLSGSCVAHMAHTHTWAHMHDACSVHQNALSIEECACLSGLCVYVCTLSSHHLTLYIHGIQFFSMTYALCVGY